MHTSATSFLRTLCTLRWVATAGQVVTILMATHAMGLALPQGPLWAGVCTLALFNLYAQRRISPHPCHFTEHRIQPYPGRCHRTHLDGRLEWRHQQSVRLTVPGPDRTGSVSVAVTLGHGSRGRLRQWLLSQRRIRPATTTQPLQPSHLAYVGMAANFLLSTVMVLVFTTWLAQALHAREREISLLRERFTRNEGIIALATHAASVAHELNTPLATMTLLADDVAEQCQQLELCEDLETLRELLTQCRNRVLTLRRTRRQAQR